MSDADELNRTALDLTALRYAANAAMTGMRYELGAVIARGGMGVIHRAMDFTLGRDVAVKVLQDRYAPDSGTARRFTDEARITAQLQHPAIPPVHDLGTLPDGRPFLAMKLIKGQTLDEQLAARPGPSAECGRFVAVFEQVCQAVAYAHAHGVLHRDLKPANVMVGAFGEVQLMDWGLAKVLASRERPRPEACPAETTADTQVVSLRDSDSACTQAGSVLGTPAFMPPEQAAGLVGKVDQRSDVFGLGAILAVILTGKPPFAAASLESTRGLAALGDVTECLARLDSCGAEPELVALCKRCLSPRPIDRPADGSEVARAVAQLRAAADERARQAELERVQAKAEKMAAEERALERRKRRQLWLGAAAALVLAALGGLTAVLVVQRRANDDLAAKNDELAREQDKVQARFQLAQKAIATFHTGISEDVLLKNKQFDELRTKLLKEAAGFYGDLEKLLEGQTDAKSRRLLAEGYYQLGELIAKIGSQPQALAVHRKGLALRRELAETEGADVEARLDVARSLVAVGDLLRKTGDPAGALLAYEELRDLALALEAESPTDAVRAMLAHGYHGIGIVLFLMEKSAEALAAYEKALAIRQELADAHPAITDFQNDLALTRTNIGILLMRTGKWGEALAAYRKALTVRQELVKAHPAVTDFQSGLADCYDYIGVLRTQMGEPAEALAAHEKALAIRQKLVDDNPAVTEFQRELAYSYNGIGYGLLRMHKQAEALAAWQKAQALMQKLTEANPTVSEFQSSLAYSLNASAFVLAQAGKTAETVAVLEQARDILQKLTDANPAETDLQINLAHTLINIGQMYNRAKRVAEALAALDTSLTICQKLIDAHPSTPRYSKYLGSGYTYRGLAHANAGHPAEAATDLRRALNLLDKDESPDVYDRFQRSQALAALAGLEAEVKSGVTTAEAATYAGQAVAALQGAVAGGWAQLDELKESEFDSLRKRVDFQRLVKELEAKAAAERRTNSHNWPQAEKK
jgi:tetratricopeptide (TPR) repeat protein